MSGVFVKLSEIFRYFGSDLDKLTKGEKYYYEELVICSAITSRTHTKIDIYGLIDTDVSEKTSGGNIVCDVPGTLKISESGEFLIEEFKCQNCKACKCEHVAGLLLFLNRHNLNKYERIKPKDLQKTREIIINARFHPRPLRMMDFGQRRQEEDDDEPVMNIPAPTEEEIQKFIQELLRVCPDVQLAELWKNRVKATDDKDNAQASAAQPSTSKQKTSKPSAATAKPQNKKQETSKAELPTRSSTAKSPKMEKKTTKKK